MARVFPSGIVSFIDNMDGWRSNNTGIPQPRDPGVVRALLSLIDLLPSELIQLTPSDFSAFVMAKEQLKVGVESPTWRQYQSQEILAIRTIHRVLSTCSDEAPAPGTTDPAFITDLDLRTDLHRDLGEVNRALQNGEWKGATVLAGSVVEALLLWALQNRKTNADLGVAASGLGKSIDLVGRPLERWDLSELIEFAHATALISDSTRDATNLGRDFRNLIHPGRARRLAQKCGRSTALIGVGAVEAVMKDLS
jgi:hypothetical protein